MTVDIQKTSCRRKNMRRRSTNRRDIVAAKDGVITEMVTREWATPLAAVGSGR